MADIDYDAETAAVAGGLGRFARATPAESRGALSTAVCCNSIAAAVIELRPKRRPMVKKQPHNPAATDSCRENSAFGT